MAQEPSNDPVEQRGTDTTEESKLAVGAEPAEDGEPEAEAPEPALAAALIAEAKHQPWPKRLWWMLTGTKKRLATSIISLIVIIAGVLGPTPLKYPLLGWFIKSDVTVVVADATAGQVLPGTTVSLGEKTATTDKIGAAHFVGVHPGKTTLTITKAAYQSSTDAFTLKFGDNGTRNVRLTSHGIRISFNLTNFVTSKPVTGARVKLADADVATDDSGRAVASVTPDGNDGQTETATITLDGYNDQTLSVKIIPGAAIQNVKLTPAGVAYYLSNRSGKVDVYQTNLDGTGASVVLAGTGNENDATGILPNVYDPTTIALVSTRGGHRSGGQLISDLYLLRPATKQLTLIDTNVSFTDYRAWLGKTLVYQKPAINASASGTAIIAYDSTTGKSSTISVCTSDGACPQALYTTDDLFVFSLYGARPGSSSNGLFAVRPGTTNAKSISTSPASSAIRQVKNTLLFEYYDYAGNLADPEQWQSLNLQTTKISNLSSGPTSNRNRTYIDSPGDKLSVLVDLRDGQSDLYLTDEAGNNERQLTSTGNVDQFVQWYGDDYVVYSAANQLFIVGVNGGTTQKITNFYSGAVHIYGGGYNPNYN